MEIQNYKDKHEYTNKNGVTSVVYLMDCMGLLKQVPDKYFELAVVDPPYGLGIETSGTYFKQFKTRGWDNSTPSSEYFEELKRVSKNQIIWGGNYFGLPAHRAFIVWDKMTYIPSMSQVEQAWTSFDSPARLCKINSNNANRIHPTEKPQALYEWIFKNYAKENDKILDTHLGSGSSRIAADRANLPFVGCELDPDYFYASVKRFREYSAQQTMF